MLSILVDFKDREHTFEEIFEFWKKKLVRLLSMKNESSEPEFEVGHVSRTRLIRSWTAKTAKFGKLRSDLGYYK